MSDPGFVVIGEWRDGEYAELQQEALRRALSREELQRLISGPREHPYGSGAHRVNIRGQWTIYPSKEARAEMGQMTEIDFLRIAYRRGKKDAVLGRGTDKCLYSMEKYVDAWHVGYNEGRGMPVADDEEAAKRMEYSA